jgi:hypothetical protein
MSESEQQLSVIIPDRLRPGTRPRRSTDDALSIYSEGMRRYPDFYLLPFNKGVTEYRLQKYDDAVLDLERSVTLNPTHASSHQFLAYSIYAKNKIAAAMALSTFLVLEPSGPRAEKNLKILLGILKANVEKKDEKNITINISPEAVNGKERGEDDFRQVEMMISFSTAADLGKDSLSAMKKLEDKLGYFAIAAHLIYYSANDGDNRQWLDANKDKVQGLSQWTAQHLGK